MTGTPRDNRHRDTVEAQMREDARIAPERFREFVPIVAPKPITIAVRQVRPELVRIAQLMQQRDHGTMTEGEVAELDRLLRAEDRRVQAIDELAEANAEGRIPHYHSLSAYKAHQDS